MYPDQTIQAELEYHPKATGTLVGGLTSNEKRDVSPLERAVNSHGEQIDKLGGLIGELEQRLAPLRNTSPDDEGRERSDNPPASMVVNQVHTQTAMIQNLQIRVQSLLSELEI